MMVPVCSCGEPIARTGSLKIDEVCRKFVDSTFLSEKGKFNFYQIYLLSDSKNGMATICLSKIQVVLSPTTPQTSSSHICSFTNLIRYLSPASPIPHIRQFSQTQISSKLSRCLLLFLLLSSLLLSLFGSNLLQFRQ